MKKTSNVLWGIVLIAAGVVFTLKAFHIAEFDILFDGWWTLFIIVPCGIGLFTEREKTGNIIGLLIGVCLFLGCRDILSFSLLWKLLVPAVIIIVGLKLVLSGLFGNKANALMKKLRLEGKQPHSGFAAFSGCDMNCGGEVFEGAELTAVFGGVECNLKNAIIEQDCAIRAAAIFGGIDIFVPAGVNVKVNSNSIFGGVSNEAAVYQDAPTIYVSGTCIFGGIDIK